MNSTFAAIEKPSKYGKNMHNLLQEENIKMNQQSIELQLKHYQDSLNYAQIIQEGLLPKRRHLNRLFQEHFLIYQPLYTVSGDFYWCCQHQQYKYIVVGDCTGHGVAGAMLTVLALGLFNYAILSKGILNTDKILQEVDKKFIEAFHQQADEEFNNDWIDVAIVRIDEKNNQIQYSAANRKLLFINQKGEKHIIEGSRYPIGGWQVEEKRSFLSTCFWYDSNDMLFLGSDGFQDQLGANGKKFGSKKLHELLAQIAHLPLTEQRKIVLQHKKSHQGTEDQTDDITLMGIRML